MVATFDGPLDADGGGSFSTMNGRFTTIFRSLLVFDVLAFVAGGS